MKALTPGHFKLGLRAVRTNRWRSLLTMLGVIIGVASVITVVSIGQGVKQQISGQINKLGKDLITVRPAQVGQQGSAFSGLAGLNVSGSLSDRDVRTVNDARGIGESVPLAVIAGSATGDPGHTASGPVIATTAQLPDMLKQPVLYGAFLSDEDAGAQVVVLGHGAAEQLFDENIPLGRSVTINGQQYLVRGIFDDFDTTPLSPDADFNDAVFIPYDTAQEATNNHAVIYEILARPTQASQMDKTISTLNAQLLKLHGGQHDFQVLKPSQTLGATNRILDLMTRLIAGIAAISLLVGGVGIMNVMLVSVTERMHEIGIRKAIGATNRQILNQFLAEATVLSVVGGLLGTLLALLIDLGLRAATDLAPVITWWVVLLATGVSLVVGVLFGSAPAIKAARKDPITALRNE